MNDSFERSPPDWTRFEPTLSHLGLKTNPNLSPLDVSMASTEECFEEDSIQSALSSFHTSLKTLNSRPSQLDRESGKRRRMRRWELFASTLLAQATITPKTLKAALNGQPEHNSPASECLPICLSLEPVPRR
ncbi:hypothetical protein QQF64_021255 [Cirrhinus molitorella]|uniref:Uncharacterized protein n=1 Tax=Cirrhinus molitorella TaxID=172907 RepID=A0ABR3LBG3_9TELE